MSEPTIYNEIALKIKGQQKEVEKLRKELKLAEENEEYWHNAFSDLEDEYVKSHDKIVKTIEILLSEDGNIPDYKLIEKAIDIIKGEDNV